MKKETAEVEDNTESLMLVVEEEGEELEVKSNKVWVLRKFYLFTKKKFIQPTRLLFFQAVFML